MIPNELSEEENAARAAFDKALTDNGGTILNEQADNANGDSYWASTETSDGSKAFYIRFGKYGSLNISKGGARCVRLVRKVSK